MTFITVTIWKSKSSKCPWRSAYAVDMKFFTHVVETTFINIKILNCNFEVSMNSSNLEVLHCPFCPLPRWYINTLHIARVMALPATRFVILQGPNNCGKRTGQRNPTLQWPECRKHQIKWYWMMLVYFLYLLGKKFPFGRSWWLHQLGKNLVGGCGSNYSFLPRICK